MIFDFMLFFNILISIYILYYGIKGSGKIYDVNYPEEPKKEYCRMLRIFCLSVGSFMLALSIVEFIMYNDESLAPYAGYVSWTNIICVLVAVVIFAVVSRKKFGKYQR